MKHAGCWMVSKKELHVYCEAHLVHDAAGRMLCIACQAGIHNSQVRAPNLRTAKECLLREVWLQL